MNLTGSLSSCIFRSILILVAVTVLQCKPNASIHEEQFLSIYDIKIHDKIEGYHHRSMNIHKRPFIILPYDPIWKFGFQVERKALCQVFGVHLKSIHHIGSTAIVGAMAKPEIDILAVVTKGCNIQSFDKKIEDMGYDVRGECLESGGVKGRYYYSKNTESIRTHKLHVCETGHSEILAKLLFVKYLSEHPLEAQTYSQMKTALSKEFNYDKNIAGYTAGKSAFISEILRKAKTHYRHLGEEDFPS